MIDWKLCAAMCLVGLAILGVIVGLGMLAV